jgi:hypothetical protein
MNLADADADNREAGGQPPSGPMPRVLIRSHQNH